MADLDITGRVTMDASQAEGAFARVGTQAGQMSNAVAGAAAKAGDAVGKIGQGSERGEQTLTRSQSRMRDEILKSTRAIENLGKTASQKLELKISTQGLDPNIYAPYLARLREVEAAQAALRNSGREAAEGAEEAASGFGSLGEFASQAKGALIGLAAGLSVGAFTGWIKGAIDSADAAGKLASSAGVAVEELAGLQLAFDGVDAGDQLAATMGKLATEAQKGNAAFAAMGITVTNSSGDLKSARDLLGEVSDKFAGYRDGAEKIALAQQLLGESGAKLIPMLNGGTEALAEYDKTARDLGLTLTTETTEAAGEFNDTIALAGQAIGGVAQKVAAQMLPTLNALAGELMRGVTNSGLLTGVTNGLSFAFKGLYSIGVGVVQTFRTLGSYLGGVGAAIGALVRGDFGQINGIMADMRKDLTTSWAAAGASISRVWSDTQDAGVKAASAVTGALGKIAPVIRDQAAAREAAKKALKEQAEYTKWLASMEADADANRQRIFTRRIEASDKLLQAAKDADAAMTAQYTSSADGAQKRLQDLEQEAEAMAFAQANQVSMAVAVEQTTIARLAEKQVAAMGNEAVVLALQKEIEARQKIVGLIASKDAKDASTKAADAAAQEWQKTADSINSSLTDALMRGFESGKDFGKNLRDTLVNMFKTLVLRPTISAILAPVAGGLSGTANAAVGGGGGALSNLSSLTNIFGSTSFANAIGAGIANATGTGISGLLATNGAYGTATGAAGSLGASFAAAMPWLLGGVAVAALWKPLFGRKLKDSGVEGTFGGERGFEGNSYEFLKGGLFRSNKTNTNPLDEEVRKGLGDAFLGMRKQVEFFADSLELQADKLAGYTGTIKLSLKGLSPEDANKKIQEALDTQSNDLAKQVLGSWETTVKTVTDRIATGFWDNETFEDRTREVTTSTYTASVFARDGEQAIDTLTRLSTSLLTVNAVFDTLGVGALTIERAVKGWFTGIKTVTETGGLAVADLASKLIDAFGGMDQFAAATSSYYEAFYSQRERTETGLRQLSTTLGKLGIALPDATASDALTQYRKLVEAQDLNTEAGRTAYAALVTLGGGFAQLVGSTQSMSEPLRTLQSDAASLLADLAEAQGDAAGAAAMRYAIETKGLNDAELAAYKYNQTLRDQITALNKATEAQKSAIEKYTAPITATSAAAALGPDMMASIAGKGADQIREFALAYVSSLDPLTEAGQKAIAAFDKLTPSIDFLIDAADVATTKADELAKGLVESVGISANTIGDTFRDVLLGRTDAKEAGESVSKMVRDGILNSLAGGFSQQITQIMVGQIITPMVQAAVAGTSISAAVSQDAIDNMLTAARNASAVLGQLFADEGFRGVLADISAAIGSATQALVPAVQPIVDLAPAADSAAIAVESLGDALGRFGESLNLRADLTAPNGGTGSSYKGSMVFDPSLSGLSQNEGPKILSQWLKDQAQGLQDSFDGQAADIDKARGLLSASALQTAVKTLEGDIERLVPIFSARAFSEGLTQFTGFFTNLGIFGIKLADELAATNDTAIGSALNLVAISDYFTGLGVEIAAVQTELGKAAALAGGGLSIDAITTGFADTIGGAATGIGAAITASLLEKVPEAIRNDPNLAGVSTAILGIVGAVKKDDVQGLNDSFLLLSGALTRGELTTLQYTTAIDYVTGAFQGAGEAVGSAAATLDDVKKRLAAVQTDIARIGFSSFQLALAEIQDRADEAAKAFGSMAPEIVALAEAERTLLNARNAATATATLDGLATETSRLDLTPLQKELAGIADRSAEYVKGLQDLGQGTDANIKAVNSWQNAMMESALAAQAAADIAAAAQGVQAKFAARNGAGALKDRLQDAMGGKGTFAAQREGELWTALAKTADYEKQIDLASQLTDMVMARQQLEVQNAERLLDFGKSLRSYVDSLKIGTLSPLTNAQKLAEAARQYQDTLGKAQGGDTTAQGNLQGIASSYLDLARTYYAGNEQFAGIFGSVTQALDALGSSSMTEAQQQLAVGTQSLSELQKLYSITETAYSALDGQYESAVAQLAAMQDALVLQTDSLDQLKALGTTMAGLPAEIAVRLPVIDTSAADAKAEKASADLLDELRALRSEVAQLRAESRQDAQMQAGVTAASADASAERIAQASAQAVRANTVQQGATLV